MQVAGAKFRNKLLCEVFLAPAGLDWFKDSQSFGNDKLKICGQLIDRTSPHEVTDH